MEEPRWLQRAEVDVIHSMVLADHGGRRGVRDDGAIESALARPRHAWKYRKQVDLPELAAAYGYGLARNHGYVDGNKRVAFVSLVLFLRRNGLLLHAPQDEAVQVMEEVAAGERSEADLARWARRYLQTR